MKRVGPALLAALTSLFGRPAAACEAVVDATLYLPDGVVRGAIRWEDGRVTAVGPQIDVEGCARVGGEGAHVTPGLVAVPTSLGLMDIELERDTRDDRAERPLSPGLVVVDGYNPDASVVGVTRGGGVTTAAVAPTGGMLPGMAGVVRLAGQTQAEAILVRRAAVVVHPGAAGASQHHLRGLLAAARELGTRGAERAAGASAALQVTPEDLPALADVAAGRLPLWIHADRASDLESWLRFAEGERVRVAFVGAAEAWRVAAPLARAGAAVVIDPTALPSGTFDTLHAREDSAARLHAAGVEVILSTFSTHHARSLRFIAGNAVRGGMDHAAAVRAITTAPARWLGLVEQGSLEVGQIADLAVWRGDPLDTSGRLVHLVVGGEAASLRDRQDALVEAWRRAGAMPWQSGLGSQAPSATDASDLPPLAPREPDGGAKP